MLVVITYDVSTEDQEGRRRLRRVARACLDFGQRVQRSVFECTVGDKELVALKQRLRSLIDPAQDSLRIYHLDAVSAGRTEHIGKGLPADLEGPLVL